MDFGPLVLLNTEALASYYKISREEVAEMFKLAPFLPLGKDRLYDARIMKTFSSKWFETRRRVTSEAVTTHFVN